MGDSLPSLRNARGGVVASIFLIASAPACADDEPGADASASSGTTGWTTVVDGTVADGTGTTEASSSSGTPLVDASDGSGANFVLTEASAEGDGSSSGGETGEASESGDDEGSSTGAGSGSGSGSEAGEAIAWPPCTDPSWWNGSYRHRVHFEIDHGVAAESLTNFPVLVRLDPSWFDYAAASPGGADLRFRGPNGGSFALPYEIDHWEEGGISTVWVEYPELPWNPEDETSDFWLYYGNPEAAPASDGADVFNRYVAVNHLGSEPRDSVGPHRAVPFDASSGYGEPALCVDECEPLIGEARDFDASKNDALMLENSASLTFQNGDRLSASLWVRTTNLDRLSGWTTILAKAESAWRIQQYANTNAPSLDFDCKFDLDEDGLLPCGPGADQHENYHVPALGTNIGDGDWHHIAISFSWPPDQRWWPPDRPLTARIYVDGVLANEQDFADPTGRLAAIYGDGGGYPIALAMKADQPTGRFFDGAIDEVRIAGDEFSPAWFRAEHAVVRNDVVQPTEWETCPPEP